MSTSEQNYGEDSAARLTERLPLDENSIGQAGSFPDVTMLTRMANEFFRGQPAPAFPASVAPSVPMLPTLGRPLKPGCPS
jgi:hypothetical protein